MKLYGSAVFAVAIALASGPAFAEPASQAAVAYGDVAIVESTGLEWQPILAQKIKTPNSKGLGIYVSLECGLYTKTTAKSKGGNKESGTAESSVKVRVHVDDEYAQPGAITFCSRSQTLSATFQGIFADESGSTCLYLEGIDTNGDGIEDDTAVRLDMECLTPEEVELVLDTMGAQSYFFYYPEATAGDHMVVVEAQIDTAVGSDGESTTNADQEATATLGHGSMGVNIIRLVHGNTGETIDLN